MSHPVLEVARWEFLRFTKVKDLVVGALIMAVSFGVGENAGKLFDRGDDEQHTVAVAGAEHLGGAAAPEFTGITLRTELSETPWSEQLEAEEVDAVLTLRSPDEGELQVRQLRRWQQRFLEEFQAWRQVERMAELELDPALLTRVAAPVSIERTTLDQGNGEKGARASFLAVGLILGAMLMGLFTGMSYLFVAITGEKTQHVTESVLSAIRPQQWIDGKILGLTGVVVVNLAAFVVGYVAYRAFDRLVLGGSFGWPSGLGSGIDLVWVTLHGVLGFGFWFTLFAVIAATVSDPNSSSRSSFMFLPMIPLGVAFVGIDDPNSFWMRLFSWIPGSSVSAMPVRLMRGEPHAWEIALSLVLAAAAVWMFRRAAGRTFGLSMLMTGKEPSLREVLRWARHHDAS